ncbi:MAG: cardiolipin synthase ClsB [Burkholderiaceae bacterium]
MTPVNQPARAREWRRAGLTARPLIYGGNRVSLLVGGDDYFPQLLAAIDGATRTVRLETYIFEDDDIGKRVAEALARAAGRGVAVTLLVDGFGAGANVPRLKARLEPLGAHVAAFRPAHWWRPERSLLRRMHRKVAVVDDEIAFVGGINIIDDHHHPSRNASLGPRFDFAVMCRGPLVAPIALSVQRLWRTVRLRQLHIESASMPAPPAVPPPFADGVRAMLLLRDNLRNRRSIEHAYLDAFETARSDVLIANAYFLPGRRFREALIALVKRGVRVRLLLQGRVEYRLQYYAQKSLYAQLLAAGIEIHEYLASYLHAKAAVVDERWSTVGSSNIDPFSLLLAREANVAIFDATFCTLLRSELEQAMKEHSRRIEVDAFAGRGLLQGMLSRLAYVIVRLLTAVAVRRRFE